MHAPILKSILAAVTLIVHEFTTDMYSEKKLDKYPHCKHTIPKILNKYSQK